MIDTRSLVRAFLPLAILLLASCSVGPKYHRPSATVPAAFKEPPPPAFKELPGWKQAQPQDTVLRGKWWEIFCDPQLNALEEQVNISNQTIAQNEAQFRAARAAIRIARADLFPTVTGGASVSGARGAATRAGIGGSSAGAIIQAPVFSASWEPDIWGRIRKNIELNTENTQAVAADLEGVKLSIHAEVASDYFSLHGLDGEKQLLDDTVAAYEKALQLTRNRYDQGVVSQLDVVQAQTLIDNAKVASTDIGVGRSQLEHAIATLLGKPPAEFSIPPTPIKQQPPVFPVALPSELLERRPDIAAAERRTASANAQIGIAMAAYYPSITLTGSLGQQGTSLLNLFNAAGRFWSVGPGLSQTLFDAGRRRGVTEQAEASYDALVAGYRQTVLVAFQDVEDNLAALRVLDAETSQQEAAVRSAQRSTELSLNRYKGGITTYLEVITAQALELSAERSAIQLLTRRMTFSVQLVRALGGGWDATQLPSASDLYPKKKT